MPEKRYATIGETPKKGQPKKAWVIPIDEYAQIDPKKYFITTGEAIVKINVLLDDLRQLSKDINKLKKLLVKTKDESDYLETCWCGGKLLVKKKDKRNRRQNR